MDVESTYDLITQSEIKTYCRDPDVKHDMSGWPTVTYRDTEWKCDPVTCTFLLKSQFKEVSMILCLVSLLLANMFFVILPCESRCSRFFFRKILGAGKCYSWITWSWVCFLPIWGVIFHLMASTQHYNGIMSEAGLLVSFFLKDMYQMALAIVMVFALIIAYLKRDLIFQMLDIDRNYIHPQNWSQQAQSTRAFYILVWCVEPAFRTMLGKTCNMFVRVAYGHNEPNHSRVHFISTLSKTPEHFGDTFSLTEQAEEEWGGGLPTLYVEVKNQEFLGSDIMGSYMFDAEDIEEYLAQMNQTRAQDTTWAGKSQQDQWKDLQFAVMQSSDLDTSNDASLTPLKNLGFQRFTLSAGSEVGGFIWLTFYEPQQKWVDTTCAIM